MVDFRYEKVSDSVTRIFGISGEMWYLVTGNDKAALLDTGSGIGHMKPLIDKLTDKPLIILLSHGHVDHASGAPEFDCPIYMNPADDAVYELHKGIEIRKEGLEETPAEILDKLEDSDYIPVRKEPFLPLKQGDTFDLGGLTVETFACAGHTPGSVVFLLREERIAVLGDACNFFTFLFFDYCLPIETFRQNLLTLKDQLQGRFDRVLLNHGDGNAPSAILNGVISVCDDIISGNTDDIPFVFRGEPALIAKAVDLSTGQRVDGGIGNVVYSKSNIRKS